MYLRFPLSLRQVEDLLFERGIDVCHETIRFWWNRFGPMFANEIRKRRILTRSSSHWCWHLDEVFVRINGETHYLWRAVDHEGEVLEVFVTKRRDRRAALKFLKRAMKRHGRPRSIITDRLRSYRSAMRVIGNATDQECGRWLNNRADNSTNRPDGESERWRSSDMPRPSRNSPPPTPQSTTTSTTTVTSTAAISSNKTVLPPWTSGISWRPERLISTPFVSSAQLCLTVPIQGLSGRGRAPQRPWVFLCREVGEREYSV